MNSFVQLCLRNGLRHEFLRKKQNFAHFFFYVPLDGARYESHEASPFLGKSGMQMPQMPQMPHIPMPQMSRKPGELPSPAASREMKLGFRGR